MLSSSATPEGLKERLASLPWRLIQHGSGAGDWNMAVDAELFRQAAAGGAPVLRFYTWDPPAISLGQFQDPRPGICWQALRRRGWEAVRRPTGGRAVLHHLELTYSIVLPPSVLGRSGVRATYRELRGGLEAALSRVLGIPLGAPAESVAQALQPGFPGPPPVQGPGRFPAAAMLRASGAAHAPRKCGAPGDQVANCFARLAPGDITGKAGKLVGSAQARRGGALLQHGSILLDADRPAWEAVFRQCGQLETVRDLTGSAPEPVSFAARLAAALRETWGLTLHSGPLQGREARAVGRSVERYRLHPAC